MEVHVSCEIVIQYKFEVGKKWICRKERTGRDSLWLLCYVHNIQDPEGYMIPVNYSETSYTCKLLGGNKLI